MDKEKAKAMAASAALEHVQQGMRLGLGSGSTMKHFIDQLGQKVAKGFDIVGMPTSEATRIQAEALNIPLLTAETFETLDLAIDGADEFDPNLNLIKGGGAAHTREKIVALSAKQFFVITDHSKKVEALGAFPLPLEVLPFGRTAIEQSLMQTFTALGFKASLALRLDASSGKAVLSDNGNLIYDAHLGVILEPEALALALDGITGLVEHGLFTSMTDKVFMASETGVVDFIKAPNVFC